MGYRAMDTRMDVISVVSTSCMFERFPRSQLIICIENTCIDQFHRITCFRDVELLETDDHRSPKAQHCL